MCFELDLIPQQARDHISGEEILCYTGEEKVQDRETVFRALSVHSLGMSLHG